MGFRQRRPRSTPRFRRLGHIGRGLLPFALGRLVSRQSNESADGSQDSCTWRKRSSVIHATKWDQIMPPARRGPGQRLHPETSRDGDRARRTHRLGSRYAMDGPRQGWSPHVTADPGVPTTPHTISRTALHSTTPCKHSDGRTKYSLGLRQGVCC